MQDLFACGIEIRQEDTSRVFRNVVADCGSWACRSGEPLDLLAAPSGRIELEGGRVVSWAGVAPSGRPERAFELELRHPDEYSLGLEWRTAIEISQAADEVRVGVRIGREATQLRLLPSVLELRRPNIVARLLDTYRCSVGSVPLERKPRRVLSVDVTELIDLLKAETRHLPMVVVSDKGENRPGVASADEIADELAGLAHVAVVSSYFAWDKFRAIVPGGDFVPSGGVRVYWPGFGRPGRSVVHRYWRARDLVGLTPPIHKRLFRMLSRASVVGVPRDPVVASLKQTLREEDIARRRREAASAAMRLRDAHTQDELLQVADELLKAKDAAIETLAGDVADLKLRLEIAEENFAAVTAYTPPNTDEEEQGGRTDAISPDDWDSVFELAEALECDSFRLTNRAKEMIIESPYPDPTRMYEHLRRLAGAAAEWASADSVGQRLADWAHETHGIEIALTGQDLTDNHFEYDGRTYDRTPHVKVDDHKDPSRCGRIYFAIDSAGRRFIVDHVGLHR